jgi:hypothetical protein
MYSTRDNNIIENICEQFLIKIYNEKDATVCTNYVIEFFDYICDNLYIIRKNIPEIIPYAIKELNKYINEYRWVYGKIYLEKINNIPDKGSVFFTWSKYDINISKNTRNKISKYSTFKCNHKTYGNADIILTLPLFKSSNTYPGKI